MSQWIFKYPHVSLMKASRRLRHRSMASSITLRFTPAVLLQVSIRRCIKSVTSGRLVAQLPARSCSQLNWGQECSAATNLEVHGWPLSLTLLHFHSGGSEWCTDCLDKHSMQERSQPEESIKTDIVESVVSQQTVEETN